MLLTDALVARHLWQMKRQPTWSTSNSVFFRHDTHFIIFNYRFNYKFGFKYESVGAFFAYYSINVTKSVAMDPEGHYNLSSVFQNAF